MKRFLQIMFIAAFLSAAAGCTSVPNLRKAYDGPEKTKDQLSYLYMVGEGRFPVNVFRIDGKNCTDTDLIWAGSYNGKWGGFNVALVPGLHSFEFAMLEENYVEVVSFTMDAGAAYEFKIVNKGIMIYKKSGTAETAVDVKRNRLSPYKQPDTTAPYGTIVQNKETGKTGSCSIVRVDGLPGSEKPAFYQYNIYVAQGDFELRLVPGKHVIEFGPYIEKDGKYYTTKKFLSKELKVEAGKKYKIEIKNFDYITSDFTLAQIDFVSFK